MTNDTARTVIRVWLARNTKTQEWLASQLKIDGGQFSKILAGYRPLTKDLAKDIKVITGLNLNAYVTESQEVRS